MLDGIAELVDKSLVWQAEGPGGEEASGPRFGMLETIRDFGLERLEAEGEATEASERHAVCYLAVAERAEAAFWGAGPGDWRALLEPEHDNFRLALAWSLERGETETALRMASALEPLWWFVGHESEGRRWLRRALADAGGLPTLRARALVVGGLLAVEQGDYEEAVALAEEGLAVGRRHGDEAAVAGATYVLGCVATNRGEEADARAHLEAALARFRALGDRGRTAWTLCDLAVLGDLGTVERPGDPAAQRRAEAFCEEALGLFRALGHTAGVARALHGLAYVAYKRRDHARALALSRETLALRWELHDRWGIAANLEDIADIAGLTGQPRRAARLYGAAEALREALGVPIAPLYRAEYEREVGVVREALGVETLAAEWTAGRGLPLAEAVAEALAVTGPAESAPSPQPSAATTAGLTARELEVLRLLVEGRSNPDIAAELFISRKTASNHVTSILAKLGVETRTAAASSAVRLGLV